MCVSLPEHIMIVSEWMTPLQLTSIWIPCGLICESVCICVLSTGKTRWAPSGFVSTIQERRLSCGQTQQHMSIKDNTFFSPSCIFKTNRFSSLFLTVFISLYFIAIFIQLSQAWSVVAVSNGSDVQAFPMQLHRRVFVHPPGFGGPHSRAVPLSTDFTMDLYAAKASLAMITTPCFPHQGHSKAQGAPRHQNGNPFHALSCPPFTVIHANCVRYSERG